MNIFHRSYNKVGDIAFDVFALCIATGLIALAAVVRLVTMTKEERKEFFRNSE